MDQHLHKLQFTNMNNGKLTRQLCRVYFNEEGWHKAKLSEEEATKYFDNLLEKGNIIYYEEKGKLLGYVEFWRINYEQLGRILCHASFSSYLENVQTGNICYFANCWIDKDQRGKREVFKILKFKFFNKNGDSDYFIGQALRKKHQPVKVFTRKQYLEKLGE